MYMFFFLRNVRKLNFCINDINYLSELYIIHGFLAFLIIIHKNKANDTTNNNNSITSLEQCDLFFYKIINKKGELKIFNSPF